MYGLSGVCIPPGYFSLLLHVASFICIVTLSKGNRSWIDMHVLWSLALPHLFQFVCLMHAIKEWLTTDQRAERSWVSGKYMIFICLQTATRPLLIILQWFAVKFESSSEALSLDCLIAFWWLFSGRVTFSPHPTEPVPRALAKALRFH